MIERGRAHTRAGKGVRGSRPRPILLVAVAGVMVLAACARGSPPATQAGSGHSAAGSGQTRAGSPSAGAVTGDLVVFAAASLAEPFAEIGRQFEHAYPGVQVIFNFAASSALAQQVLAGAPADVFASASPATMAEVTEAGAAAGRPTVFVRNRLEIAVPPGNPGRVGHLEDFADEDRTIALCAPQVPCGAAAVEVFHAAGVTPAPDTLELDVKAALTKVELGEVDAALVYHSDVQTSGGAVEGIAVPEAGEAINDYPVVALRDAPNLVAAQAFLHEVLAPRGQRALVEAGFTRSPAVGPASPAQ